MILQLFLLLLLLLRNSFCLEVNVGGQAFIDVGSITSSLPFNLQSADTCVISVEQHSGIQLGRIRPRTFSCNAPDNLVRYVHSGDPFPREDEVHFVVRGFHGPRVVESKVQLRIHVTNIPRSFELPSLEASSSTFTRIEWNVVRPNFNVPSDSRCTAYVDIEPPSPLLYHPNFTSADLSSLPCESLPKYFLKLPQQKTFTHHMSIGYEITTSEGLPIRETRFVMVHPLNMKHLPNFPPQIRLGPFKSLHMSQHSLLIIQPNLFAVSDDATPLDFLTIKTPRHNSSLQVGYLVHLGDKWKPITTFKYGELVRRKIAFRGPVRKLHHPASHELCLSASDLQHAESQTVCLFILIKPILAVEPMVVEKKDIPVLRGSAQVIETRHLGLLNSDEAVMQVKGGPYGGSILLGGKSSVSFNYADFKAGRVLYSHDGGMDFDDKIIFKVSTDAGSVRFQLDIKIVEPVDETVPRIVANKAVNVSERETPLTSRGLDAVVSEFEEDNDDLMFSVVSSPRHGVLREKPDQFHRGFIVTNFSRKHLKDGMIYYHVLSNSSPLIDSIHFTVKHVLIRNASLSSQVKLTLSIDLRSSSKHKTITKCPGTNLTTSLADIRMHKVLTSRDLCYTISGESDGGLIYVVTSAPRDTDSQSEAGTIIKLRLPHAQSERRNLIDDFNQTMIDAGIVGYKPPFDGRDHFSTRTVHFKFSVTCAHCMTLYDQVFTFRFPTTRNVTSSLIVIKLGETKLLNEIFRSALGGDEHVVALVNNPQFGVLVRDGSVVKVTREWNIKEFLSKNIWYQHSHQICSKDEITFSTNHSAHRVDILAQTGSRTFSIEHDAQTPLNDDLIASKILSPPNSSSRLDVIKQPQHGYIYVIGREATDQFSLDELKSQMVFFKADNRRESTKDSFLLLHSSHSDPEIRRWECALTLFNVSVSLTPRDPSSFLSKRSVTLNLTSRNFILTPKILGVYDETPEDETKFVVVRSPSWGRLLRSSMHDLHSAHSDVTVTTFTRSDLKKNLIRYSLNSGRIDSTMDSFHFYVADGRNTAVVQVLLIVSVPVPGNIVKRRNHRNVNKSISGRTYRTHKIDVENQIQNNHPSTFAVPNQSKGSYRRRSPPNLRVEDIQVNRRGQVMFTVFYERSPQRRRSMSQSILSLAVPPTHGNLILLKNQQVPLLERRETFHNLSLADVSNEIKMLYRHDGSTSSNDHFVLSLSNDNNSIKKVVPVKVASKAKGPIHTELIRNQGLIIGRHHPVTLNSSSLLVRGNTTNMDDIQFELLTQTKWGYLKILHQHLESSESPLEVGSFFTQLDINENRVLYVPSSTSLGNDSFTFKVNSDPRIHTFKIFSSQVILDPLNIVLGESPTTCLEDNSLFIFEDDDLTCLIVAVNTEPLFGSLGEKGQTFPVEVLLNGGVCYSKREDSMKDEFELTLVNKCLNATVASRKFVVESKERTSPTPRLDVSVPLMVIHGEKVSLAPFNIKASCDGVDPSGIFFIVVDPPRHGNLLMNGRPTKEFSQEDINSEFVFYESNQIDDSMMDYFLFSISTDKSFFKNSSDIKASFFSILIQPASKTLPQLYLTSPNRIVVFHDNRFVFRLNSSHLRATHSTFSSRELVYHIKSKTKHGHLEISPPGRQVRRKFTQKDVDENKLIYVIRNDSLATNDTFTFKLVDPNMNTIDNQRFAFEWSVVEFENSQMRICKGGDLLTVPVIRRGLLTEASTVQIKAKYSTDEELVEQFKLSSDTINFDRGSNRVDWTMKSPNNGQVKAGIKIKLSLFNGTGVVIGKTDKAAVHFGDAKAGCPNKNATSTHETYFKLEDFYEDGDYEDDSDDGDDYLESDWSYYSDRMSNIGKEERDPSLMALYGNLDPNIPQPCNPSTKSLLFLDLVTSQLFKCNGKHWEKWGWASNASGHKPPEKETLEEKSQKTCPLGWLLYGDNCFLSSKVKMTWTEAEEICRRDGGHLSFVISIDHLAWLSSLTDGSKFWIGLNNRREVSQWEFTGSALFSSIDLSDNMFYNWGAHQPCTKCPRSRCVQASEQLLYSNKQCTKNRARFVCARPSRLLRTSRKAKQRRTGRHRRIT